MKVKDPSENGVAVDFVALVDDPAIQKGWMAFAAQQKFIEPQAGENESDFMKRCVPYEGKDQDQAVAVCSRYFKGAADYQPKSMHEALTYILGLPIDAGLPQIQAALEKHLEELKTKPEGAHPASHMILIDALKSPTDKETDAVSILINSAKKLQGSGNELKVGDSVKVKSGKEHDPSHAGLTMTIAEIVDGSIALKMPDGSIHKWYVADELEKVNGQKFSFQITDKERRLITGPLMIADLPIYRRDEEHGEYMVVFRKPEIEKIIKKFGKSSFFNNVNWMHDDSNRPEGIYLFESMFVDKERGVSAPSVLEGITDGSWVGTYYVENDQVWEDIKQGKVVGFSVQGFFEMAMNAQRPVESTDDGLDAAFERLAKIL